MGTQVKFKKGTKSKIDAKPISDGALYVSTDTKELFVDSGTQRISIGGAQGTFAGATTSGGPALKVVGTENTDNTDKHIWFSGTEEESRGYDSGLTYNPSKKLVKSGNVSISKSVSCDVANGLYYIKPKGTTSLDIPSFTSGSTMVRIVLPSRSNNDLIHFKIRFIGYTNDGGETSTRCENLVYEFTGCEYFPLEHANNWGLCMPFMWGDGTVLNSLQMIATATDQNTILFFTNSSGNWWPHTLVMIEDFAVLSNETEPDYSAWENGNFSMELSTETISNPQATITFPRQMSDRARKLCNKYGYAYNIGSSYQPVYFSEGIPTMCMYKLEANVPSDAKFTDTTYGLATAQHPGLLDSSDKSKLDGITNITDTEIDTIFNNVFNS